LYLETIVTPTGWLFAVAKRRPKDASNYFLVVRGDSFVENVDLQAALTNAEGRTLYAFCEPSQVEIDLARAAGIKRVYCCISMRDGYKLGFMSSVLPTVTMLHPLKPIKIQLVRTKILKWLRLPVCQVPNPALWLLVAAKQAVEAHSNYFVVVRGDSVVEDIDLQTALVHVEGGTLYAFCELTPRELGLAETAGIKAIYCGISKRDGVKLGIYHEGLKPIKVKQAREVILREWVSKW
jgi:hypothetical protein